MALPSVSLAFCRFCLGRSASLGLFKDNIPELSSDTAQQFLSDQDLSGLTGPCVPKKGSFLILASKQSEYRTKVQYRQLPRLPGVAHFLPNSSTAIFPTDGTTRTCKPPTQLTCHSCPLETGVICMEMVNPH